MGSIVKATCSCGLDQEVTVGAGMINFKTKCYFPCYCEHCEGLIEADIMSSTTTCPDCNSEGLIPYTEPNLSSANGSCRVTSWRLRGQELQLDDGHYLCPSCKTMSLRFSLAANFD